MCLNCLYLDDCDLILRNETEIWLSVTTFRILLVFHMSLNTVRKVNIMLVYEEAKQMLLGNQHTGIDHRTEC